MLAYLIGFSMTIMLTAFSSEWITPLSLPSLQPIVARNILS